MASSKPIAISVVPYHTHNPYQVPRCRFGHICVRLCTKGCYFGHSAEEIALAEYHNTNCPYGHRCEGIYEQICPYYKFTIPAYYYKWNTTITTPASAPKSAPKSGSEEPLKSHAPPDLSKLRTKTVSSSSSHTPKTVIGFDPVSPVSPTYLSNYMHTPSTAIDLTKRPIIASILMDAPEGASTISPQEQKSAEDYIKRTSP